MKPFPDEFGIGQEKVARIQLEISRRDMAKYSGLAFSTGYVNELVRASYRRMFRGARDNYERAKEILGENA